MTMQPYPSYKDSGVEWIGEIPEHWIPTKLKRATQFLYGDSLPNESREEGDIPVYGSNGIVGFHSESIATPPCIVVGRKGSFGKVNYSEKNCFPIDTTYFIDENATKQDIRWLYYVLQTLELDVISKDSAVPGLSREDAYEKLIILSPIIEQHSITSFLDAKTGQIDSLIDKKRRLIELLKEQRAAVINQAVTKGLDPNVKMKDSRIEWLGEIPEHWEVRNISRTFRVIGSGTTPKSDKIEYYNGGRVNWVITGDLNDNLLNNSSKKITDKALQDYSTLKIYPSGTLIIAMYGATIGKISLINFEACTNQACCALTDSPYLSDKFTFYWFLSQRQNIINMSFGGGQPNISQDVVRSLKISTPPLPEQLKIVNYLDQKTQQLDNLIEKEKKSIDHLSEYRSALISEAVTGKIDVRNHPTAERKMEGEITA
ncbi:EcoKI restriction-modification system protein HsdS [archaeon BMS3Abin16]|nr:EcoKI restriction-modification system protein HsdS [archaeon BMS3Abin16]HDY74454.1 restriction endonuclease subunit S [Euryarchaeota archaeon]